MSVENKTIEKLQTIEKLINELVEMRHQIIELKASEMQRQMTAAALQALENKYKTLMENIPQKLFVKDKNSVYQSCSESFARDLKIKPEEIAGKTDLDFFPRELAEKYMAAEKRVMESGLVEETEEDYRLDGQQMIVHMIRIPLRSEKGEVNGILGTFWDITQEKQKEKEIKKEISLKEEKIQELSIQLAEIRSRLEREINQRNLLEEEFARSKNYLEGELRARQEELQNTNERLQGEIEEHKRVAAELKRVQEEFSITKAALEDKISAYTNELKAVREQREQELAEQKRLREELAQGQEKILNLESKAVESSAELNRIKEQLAQEIRQLKEVQQYLEQEKERTAKLEKELNEKNEEITIWREEWQKEQNSRKSAEEALQKKEKELSHLQQESSLTSEIGKVLGSTITLEETYQRFTLFADEVKKLIPFDRLAITIINPEDNTLQISYALGKDVSNWPEGESRPLAGSSAEEVMRTRTSLLVQEDNQEEAKEFFPDLQTYLSAGFRSMLFVPLPFGQRVLGVLNILSTEKNAYSKDVIRIAEKLAAQMAGAIGKGQQILERQKREERLKMAEEKFRSVVEKSPLGIWVSRTGKVIYANPKCRDVLGYTSEEIIDKILPIYSPDKERIMDLLTKWESGEIAPASYICRFSHKDGQIKWLETKTGLVSWEGQPALIHFLNDITQRKNIEETLRQSIEPFRRLVQAVEDIVAALKEEAQ